MSKKNCSCYDCTWRRERQEFLHTHGGPEEMPHRKTGKGKPFQRSDHKHIYETNGWVIYYGCKRVERPNGDWAYVTDYDRIAYRTRQFYCLECDKAGNRDYEWKRK